MACWNGSNMPSRVPCSNFCRQLPLSEKVITPFSILLGFLVLWVLTSMSSSSTSVFSDTDDSTQNLPRECLLFSVSHSAYFLPRTYHNPYDIGFISSLFMLACVFTISFLSIISNILQSLHFLHALLKLQHAGVHCRDEK